MKRTRTVAVVGAFGLALALSGVAVARNPHAGTHGSGNGHGPSTNDRTLKTKDRTLHTNDRTLGPNASTAPVLMTVWVKGNTTQPGGTLRILALVQAPVASRPDSVDAIVHLDGGDQTVTLLHNGNGHGVAYHGTVAVPDTQPAGQVAIDATATVGGQPVAGTGFGRVVAPDTADQSSSAEPDASERPDASESPDASEAPDASESPDASEAPEESEAPDASESPEPSESAEDGDGNDQGDNASAGPNQDVIAQVIALLQSLLG